MADNNKLQWYVFERGAETTSADVALLSKEQADFLKTFLENKLTFYDEGYSGSFKMLPLGAFDTKEDAIRAYIDTERWINPADLLPEYKDMYPNTEKECEL
jgi:hypothetical protein